MTARKPDDAGRAMPASVLRHPSGEAPAVPASELRHPSGEARGREPNEAEGNPETGTAVQEPNEAPGNLDASPAGKIDVQKAIDVHLVGGGCEVCGCGDEGSTVWVHTHGLVRYGKPELEIRDVPLMLMAGAGMIINSVASYILSHEKPKLGAIYGDGRLTLCYFMRMDPIDGAEDHFVEDRWALVHPSDAERLLEPRLCRDVPHGTEVIAYLLGRAGYEAGGDDMMEYMDKLVDDDLVIRMPQKADQLTIYEVSSKGMAVYQAGDAR